ncbi:MAG: S-layer homology domain-containing protein [Oscillospiraceae bacterium]|nr:S-layer homology domain-containing protein [Oscillospiraceae bacterium]
MKKRILAICLAVVLLVGMVMPASAQELTAQQQLMQNIAAGYLQSGDEWTIMDMCAYASVEGLAMRRISANAKQAYLDKAIETLTQGGVSETACSKMILALHALGIDAQELYAAQMLEAINAVELLKQFEHGQSVWSVPYTLAVFNHGEYETEQTEQELVDVLLASQNADGSWNEYGAIDDTANAISGLAFYYDTDENVAQALDAAVEFLSAQQKDSGAFDGGWGENSNSTATVIVALAALGIDVTSDERFIKNGSSLMDALMSFALENLSGFGYMDAESKNAYSTEQCFRALIAAQQVADRQSAFNVYDLHAATLKAGYASGAEKPGGGFKPDEPEEQMISISFSVQTDTKTWIEPTQLEVPEGASVKDALNAMCQANDDLRWSGTDNYVSSIGYRDETLRERDAGAKSGWKYKVNGTTPLVSMDQCILKQSDKVVWYYVTDYTQDKTPGGSAIRLDGDNTDEDEDLAASAFADITGHWANAYIQDVYEKGLLVGVGKNIFAPDAPMNRAMLATVLWRMAGKPAAAKTVDFDDVSASAWYCDAVAWAKEEGIIKGVAANKFAPQQALTREHLVLMLLRYARAMGYDTQTSADLSAFSDAKTLNSNAKEAFAWAVDRGIVKGTDDQTLAPAQQTTRAQIAAVLSRLLAKERT